MRAYAARPERRLLEALAGSNTTRIRIPVAFANLSNVDRLGLADPLSSRAMVDCEVPIFFARFDALVARRLGDVVGVRRALLRALQALE